MVSEALTKSITIRAMQPRLKLVSAPSPEVLVWDDDVPPAHNYEALGKRLAACGDLFRQSSSKRQLVLVLPHGKRLAVSKGAELGPIIVDRVEVRVVKNGKDKGTRIPAHHVNTMLQTQAFLGQFSPVDQVTAVPMYLPDFTRSVQGYNDGGEGYRILYSGSRPSVSSSLSTINKFLDVMAWESSADRTNAVAAALTVMLRNHWPGGKPIVLATATKSHAGKDTVLDFASGLTGSVSISYQGTDWALERNFVGAINTVSDAGVVVIDNARLDGRNPLIASAFLERFATDPEPLLFATGTGPPVRRRNDLVLAISTNFGKASEDILNRSLPIHLHPKGDVARRRSPIGNPRFEFLPANKDRIAAELRGMIERWKMAGQPFDPRVKHSFSLWARTIGGILRVNGFEDFLANYGQRKTADNTVRRGLAIMGSRCIGRWLQAFDWAELAVDLGLTRTMLSAPDRENDASRARAIDALLSAHDQETFEVEMGSESISLKLERRRGQWYRFVVDTHGRHKKYKQDHSSERRRGAVVPELLSLSDCAKRLGIVPRRIAGKRIYTSADVARVAEYFGINLVHETTR